MLEFIKSSAVLTLQSASNEMVVTNTVMNMGILFCSMAFDCPKQWDELTPTEDALVRDCTDCGQSVHFIDDQTQLDRAALDGKCVAFVNQIPEKISPEESQQLLTMQEHHTSLRTAVMRRVTLGLPRRRDNDKLRAFLNEFPDPKK